MDAPFGASMSLALTISGAIISVVPTQLRAMVPFRIFATPKSITLIGVAAVISFPQTRMFSTFRSLWTTSRSWMNWRPAVVCRITDFTMSSGNPWPLGMKLANSPPSISSMTIIIYWAWEVPGLKASKHPRHSQMLGWPWICCRTSVSFRMDAIFSSHDGSMSKRQIGIVLTACFVFGVLLLWQRYTVPWPPTPSTLSVSISNGSSGGPKTLNCSIDPNARAIVLSRFLPRKGRAPWGKKTKQTRAGSCLQTLASFILAGIIKSVCRWVWWTSDNA